jgi:hypothetical protein
MNRTLEQDDWIDTCKIMAAGLLFAIIINLPLFSTIYDKDWSWTYGFPLGWLGTCLAYMTTFFHELGHAVMFWFYGYIALPHFDFQDGGGLTTPLTNQLLILHLALYAFLGWWAWTRWRDNRIMQGVCLAIGLFHLATAHNQVHEILWVFAGPLAQVLVGGILLFRAWLDTPPTQFERFLSAGFGFAMIFMVLIDSWALIHNDVWRLVYFEQKGAHAYGDFDRIADITDIRFSVIIWFWMSLGVLALILPAISFKWCRQIIDFINWNTDIDV